MPEAETGLDLSVGGPNFSALGGPKFTENF